MKRIDYTSVMDTLAQHLAQGGVFLTVGGDQPNTMTIGWATIGYVWQKPVFMALVRPQRHTCGILSKQGEFTVSIPTKNPLRAELAFAGTKSGRDFDKFCGHGLTAVAAQTVHAPIVGECGLHLECKVLLTQPMCGEQMHPDVQKNCYPLEDYHIMFFGEIVDCYSTDE